MPETSARLLRLLSLLQTPRDWPGSALAERLGVDVRTVRRDIDKLRCRTFRLDRLRTRVPAGPRFAPRELTVEKVASRTSQGVSTAAYRYRARASCGCRWSGPPP
ncbi:biotin operon repressor [Streptomyces candidus]|uniref:Biotin operon repressor n=1 Tax=Streptomyces candidus TaxID=67283 RepID=A0A7X0HC16_9ACTN|nr:biotin operon repressor [Streptomyces candidus]